MSTLQMNMLFCFIWLFFIQLSFTHAMRSEVRCGSVDIRNDPRMAFLQPRQTIKSYDDGKEGKLKYKECTILEGDFTISMITKNNVTDDMFPVFENLREITGSILVFQIRGLTSLGRMFPNLRVIGGHSLIMNYALVVYQNYDLRDIGLTKLTTIKNGGVRITENPRLCYARSIDWKKILIGKIRDLIIDQVAGQCKNTCPGTKEDNHCHVEPVTNQITCWNSTHCQATCTNVAETDSGCTDTDEVCHEQCIGGCTKPNDDYACFSCRYLDWNGRCIAKCPDYLYEQLGRRCLNKEECKNLYPISITVNPNTSDKSYWKPFNKQCNYECPTGYREDPIDPHSCVKCDDFCPKKCQGDVVDSISSALKFSKCNMIEGNLEIDMRIGIESTTADKFTEAFGEIEEITGYLLIRFSSAFMSLHMFAKLRRIHGKQLWKNIYALVVFENQNLRQLFNIESTSQRIEIVEGKVSFQNNRMLCYDKIKKLIGHLNLEICKDIENEDKNKCVGESDVSPFSNGDKAICDEIPLDVKIVSVYNYGFVISWTPFNTTDMDHRKFLGYQIFYKKVDKINPNMTIDDDRSACSDSWNMYFVTDGSEIDSSNTAGNNMGASSPKGELINQGIEANTLYAVYVQTRVVNHPGAKNAISPILYVKTLFGMPDPPRMRISEALSPNSIKLSWDPPLESYGDITHYLVSWNLPIEYNTITPNIICEKRINTIISNIPSKTLPPFVSQDTCSKEGCCKCPDSANQWSGTHTQKITDANKLDAKRKDSTSFEDIIQNTVFVQKNRFQRNTVFHGSDTSGISKFPNTRFRREISTFTRHSNNLQKNKMSEPYYYNHTELDVANTNLTYEGEQLNYTQGKINVTGTTLILSGLPHYSEYHITVHACQDITAQDFFCSGRPAWTSARTLPIPEYDMVDTHSVRLSNLSDTKPNERHIYWDPPTTPNGFILAYRAKLLKDDDSTPLEQCIPFEKFENESGITFSGLSDGVYTLEIRVETTALLSSNYHANYTIINDLFIINNPGFFTWKTILIMSVAFFVFISISGVVIYYTFNRMYGKKVEEYLRQTISANPEYLSQIELYKADEWELKRDDIILEQEIGRGTFGKVYRGYGKSVQSINGDVFGDCAVKTVPETASNAERLHFLIEASVMKQFNTPFIVKLYGVVSDGQPVLVVMELMEKGNLRDFLRSHRPGAEENKENRPLPTAGQYFNWAAQIADGMAYLESLKFCHRDLAARNCMVHADESVKIGDFGMARDIYYHEYYKPAGKRLMPVRWMAPESLKDGKFTLKSDVWSYGIVLYEMLTLGQQPYAGLGNDQVFNYTGVQRHVLNRPTGCPDFWYSLMLFCWKYDPRERPTFRQIVHYLESYISEEFKKLSFVLNDTIKPIELDSSYDFNIDLEDEILKRNVISDEYAYGQDDDENAELTDFASEDEFQKPICFNNRRDEEKQYGDEKEFIEKVD